MEIRWTKRAIAQLQAISQNDQKAIVSKVAAIASPGQTRLDIVKLACRQARYRLQVGDYRVIFERRQGVPVICLIMEVKRRTTTTYLN
ncbi:hypothetical protein SMZ34_002758 [Cronobacter sakazakii]|nr:hypothetical protein [Cronobacter sakazakii]ELY4372126.1 hypothetical protein [Cronobacter sakazakii]